MVGDLVGILDNKVLRAPNGERQIGDEELLTGMRLNDVLYLKRLNYFLHPAAASKLRHIRRLIIDYAIDFDLIFRPFGHHVVSAVLGIIPTARQIYESACVVGMNVCYKPRRNSDIIGIIGKSRESGVDPT